MEKTTEGRATMGDEALWGQDAVNFTPISAPKRWSKKFTHLGAERTVTKIHPKITASDISLTTTTKAVNPSFHSKFTTYFSTVSIHMTHSKKISYILPQSDVTTAQKGIILNLLLQRTDLRVFAILRFWDRGAQQRSSLPPSPSITLRLPQAPSVSLY